MKRFFTVALCILFLLTFVGCNSNESQLKLTSDTNESQLKLTSGTYYMSGDFDEGLTPYLGLDTDNSEFGFGAGTLVSYQEYGSYEIVDGKIIATSQSTTFEFEIKDNNTLVLIDNGDNDYFKIPINAQFVYSEDSK